MVQESAKRVDVLVSKKGKENTKYDCEWEQVQESVHKQKNA